MAQDIIDRIQTHIDNTLDPSLGQKAIITGIFGDRPSVSAKSPSLWNAAYKGLDIDAAFVPLDVSDANLPGLVSTLREIPSFAGGSVTVPHKSRIMELLDEIDPKARQIGAVNAVARTKDHRLIGYNTDAQGAIDCLTKSVPGQPIPFLADLNGLRVLQIGAGGAGRAVAFSIAEAIGPSGSLLISNRTASTASELACGVNRAYGNAGSVEEADLASVIPDVGLIINASLRGQSGLRPLPGGRVTCFEPYSALAPANPADLSQEEYLEPSELQRAWYLASLDDIRKNQAIAAQTILKADASARVLDIIYSPLETTLLVQSRLAGHATINGKVMNLAQAVDGFVNRVMREFILSKSWDVDQVYGKVYQAMAEIW